MNKVIVTQQSSDPSSWTFLVMIGSNPDQTTHQVTLTKKYWEKLTDGKTTPEYLIKKSFEFLLNREPKESILSTFDLTVINKYFPEYEDQITSQNKK
jgi:hypothetical protein